MMMNQYEIDYKQGYDAANDEWLERIDKIKAEILKLDDINPDYPMDRTIHINRNEVLNILDKYR